VLAGELLGTVRETQAHGPYCLVGYSLGGLLAYEIAGQMRAAGEEVAWLGVLDTRTPDWLRHELTPRQIVARLRRRGPRWALGKLGEVARHELAVRLPGRRGRESATSEQFDLIGAAKLAARYACTPHDAPLDLFVSESTAFGAGSYSLGWDQLHRGPLRVHRIGGDHEGMMRAGPVDTVAEIVSTALKEARP
jgi:thioesterase domain-containing protein